jgi:hypothetical protein
MAGVMANARQWEKFEWAFQTVKKEFGFKVFHTKEFKKKRGDLRGWSNEKCLALASRMADLTEGAFTDAVTFALINADYDRFFRNPPGMPRKNRIPSKYGLCFEECLFYFTLEANKRKHRDNWPTLHFVCESGAENAGDAQAIFHERKRWLSEHAFPILGTITFADQDEADPLMIADLWPTSATPKNRLRLFQ